ncbi:MAG: hypothetical protein IKK99_04335 [Oscillospiraceae bacterium]|nr:hypothetical protein [Oscillospiraceae bacterium]
MAGGKPVLTCIDGEGSYVIEKAQAGLTAPSGDSHALYKNIVKLYSMSQSDRDTMGANARRYHFEYHSRDKVLQDLINFILD